MPSVDQRNGASGTGSGSGPGKEKRKVLGGNKPMKPKFRKQFDQVFQLKIVVKDSNPPIWRKIEVPSTFDFTDLHHAIQDAMHGWLDYHLYNYTFPGVIIDDTEPDVVGDQQIQAQLRIQLQALGINVAPEVPEERQDFYPKIGTKLSVHFKEIGNSCIYLYDFGDDWAHEVILEGISPKEEGMIYPRILDGERACPPEDAGGMDGYKDKLEILRNPNHEEYEEIVDWVYMLTGTQRDGQNEFNPEYFNKEKVVFTKTTP